MPSYRRVHQPGGTYFLTIVTDARLPLFTNPTARRLLRTAISTARQSRPFTIDAIVLLPEHFHLMMTLPAGDVDYPTRIAHLKSLFTKSWLATGHAETARSAFRLRTRRRGVWQPRFWEHTIRDQSDYNDHLDYIHYNPIKHNHTACPHEWPHATFHCAVKQNLYTPDWLCSRNGNQVIPPTFESLPTLQMELES